MNKVMLAEGIYYVGAVDWNQRDFHGYVTPRGVTYNSYLIVDEKICLIDNVKAPFSAELIDRISKIVPPEKIDYVITNHIEPDHSGSLPALMARVPQAKVVLTEHGKNELIKHYHQEYDFQVVAEGDSISLGKRRLHFVPMPMLHWPDSMACYLEEDQILFSNDAFGQHICTTKRFDDENSYHDVMYEAAKYYANILMPFGKLVVKAVDKVRQLPLKMIAPSHGIVWRKNIADILMAYDSWGAGAVTDKVVIVYDTMWGSTDQMARVILDGVAASGANVKLFKLSTTTLSEIAVEVLDAGGILIGSSTHNNGPMASVGGFLTYLRGLRPTNKLGAAFGSYGWGGGAQKTIEETLERIGATLEQGVALKWVPTSAEKEKCFEFGLEFGKKVLAKAK